MKNATHLKELVLDVMQDNANGSRASSLVFESFFDLTRPRLEYIFNSLDAKSTKVGEGVVDYKNLLEGIRTSGIDFKDDHANFLKLMEHVDLDLDGGITFNEFETLVQSLKMNALLKTFNPAIMRTEIGYNSKVPKIRVIHYNVAKCEVTTLRPQELGRFLYAPRPDWAEYRWIDVGSTAPTFLKAMAIKYRLHPLSLEDALINKVVHRGKVDRYENNLFVVFPTMELVEDPSTSYREESHYIFRSSSHDVPSSSSSSSIDWYDAQIGLKRAAPRSARRSAHPVVDSAATDGHRPTQERQTHRLSKPDSDDALMIAHANVNIFVSKPVVDTIITVGSSAALLGAVQRELEISYSKLRSKDTMFLMYTMIDAFVDGYSPVLSALETHIMELREFVSEEEDHAEVVSSSSANSRFGIAHRETMRELSLIKRRLTPAQRVITHLVESDVVDNECKIYLKDVKDHLEETLEQLGVLVEDCRAVKAEQENALNLRMTKTMSTLTIVGTVFMPAQFLSSVFGMNFTHFMGFDVWYGYPLFWLVCVVSWISMGMYFRDKGFC